jgi:thymidylate synthase
MNNLDKQYIDLLNTIIEHGVIKKDRTGVGTQSIFGYTIRHNMADGFPAITTKKLAFKTMVTELLWFLRGETNIKFLVDNNCNIWNGDAYKAYEKWNEEANRTSPFGPVPKLSEEDFVKAIKLDDDWAKRWGELGPIYGKQWRGFKYIDKGDFINTDNMEDPLVGGRGLFFQPNEIDQIENLINDLKNNPDSRRLMVTAWNPGELDQMVLPPCHYGFQMYTRELSLKERVDYGTERGMWKLGQTINYMHCDELGIPTRAVSLMWNQRSVDTFLGLPFNIASYGLLLEIIAKEVNMVPDQLVGNLGDTHLYLNHIEEAKEQIKNEPYDLPTLSINENNKMRIGGGMFTYEKTDFELLDYKCHKTIKAKLNN